MKPAVLWLALAGLALGLAGYAVGRRTATATGNLAGGPQDATAQPAGAADLALRAELSRLRSALAAEREGRESREREWLEFTRAMASLGVADAPAPPGFLEAPETDPGTAEVPPAPEGIPEEPDPALARASEIRRDLRALLLGEQVLGLDVLEVGRVHDGATGPVVVRLLDDRGRPSGLLASERLRLECSRAARSVTLVFEDGYERFGNRTLPFGANEPGSRAADEEADVESADAAPPGGSGKSAESRETAKQGARRIDLPHVDPRPWIELLPELFRAQDLTPTPDDGKWERVLVMQELNRLLRATQRGGRWRLAELGGVAADTLWEVRLEQLDGQQRVIQRIFADRLRIQGDGGGDGGGILLLLEDGVAERNGKRAPFFDGRYRIFLPAAPVADWRAADLPHALEAAARGTGPEQG